MKRVIIPNSNQVVLADPTVLSPEQSPDGIWHLFCWTLVGIAEFISEDGENWIHKQYVLQFSLVTSKKSIIISNNGVSIPSLLYYAFNVLKNKTGYIHASIRPFIFINKDTFYLFYQDIIFNWEDRYFTDPICAIKSISSKDLIHWTEPKTILKDDSQYFFIACPSMELVDSKYVLYFSYDKEFTDDNSLWEPKRVAYAISDKPDSDFIIQKEVEVLDEKGFKCNQVGSLRTRKINSKHIYSCNPIYRTKDNESISDIYILNRLSQDKFTLAKKILKSTDFEKYKISDAYVADFVKFNKNLHVYFNIRRVNRFFDKFKFNRGTFGVFYLLFKNTLLNREDIYLIKKKI